MPWWTLFVLAAALIASTASVASAQDDSEPKSDDLEQLRADQAQVKQERALVASEVDVLEGEYADVDAALADLDANVKIQEARLLGSQQALATAESELRDLETQHSLTEAVLADLRVRVSQAAVRAYVGNGGSDLERLSAMLGSADPLQAGVRTALLQARIGSETDLAEELRAAEGRSDARPDPPGGADRAR